MYVDGRSAATQTAQLEAMAGVLRFIGRRTLEIYAIQLAGSELLLADGRFLFCRRKTAHVQNQRTPARKRVDFPVMHLAETLRRIVLLGRELFFRCQLRSVRSVLKS
jgi:hypothetical protein